MRGLEKGRPISATSVVLLAALSLLIMCSTAIGQLSQQAEIARPGTSGSGFGRGEGAAVLALSADGDTAVIGEPNEGHVFIFARSGSTWSQQTMLSSRGANFGASVALSADGDTVIATSRGSGASVFTRSGSTWTLQSDEGLEPGSVEGEEGGMWGFGNSVSLSSDGSTAVIGAISQGKAGDVAGAWVFRRTGSNWTRTGLLRGDGESVGGTRGNVAPGVVSISGDGRTIVMGDSRTDEEEGGAWVFEESGGHWVERSRLTAPEATGPGLFGGSVSLSRDGSTALVGASYDAYGGGGAWAYSRGQDGWHQQGPEMIPPLEPQSGRFGWSVALSADGTSALIGAPNNDYPDLSPGAVWLYRRSGERWWPEQKIPDPVIARDAATGSSVALSDDASTALFSSPGQHAEGAAWVFTGPTTTGSEIAPAPPAVSAKEQWGSLGGDPGRTATVAGIKPPFRPLWSTAFPAPAGTQPVEAEEHGERFQIPAEEFVGYPLLGNGLVYVTRSNRGSPEKTEIDALSQQTGRLVWSREMEGGSDVYTALDGTRLFAMTGDFGGLLAFDALTGKELWQREEDGTEPLVATEGVLYFVTAFVGAETVAVDETTGRTLWESSLMYNNTGAGPLVGDGRVYTMGAASQEPGGKGLAGWAWDEKTGKLLWEVAAEGTGDRGPSWTAELAEGRLWTTSEGALNEYSEPPRGGIADPATGAQLGNYQASNSNSPIIDGEDVISLAEHWTCQPRCSLKSATLTATDMSGNVQWTFEGDGGLNSGLIRVGDDVLAGSSSGNLYAVDQATGSEVWKAKMPSGFIAENLDPIGPPTGMAASGNVLAVVTRGTLTMMTTGAGSEEPGPEPVAPSEPPATTSDSGASTTENPVQLPSTLSSNPFPGAAIVGPSGAVAGFHSSARATCAVRGPVGTRALPDGAMRLRVTVSCPKAEKVTVLAGYRPRARSSLVSLARRTLRVPRGATPVTLMLTPGEQRSIRSHGQVRVGLATDD